MTWASGRSELHAYASHPSYLTTFQAKMEAQRGRPLCRWSGSLDGGLQRVPLVPERPIPQSCKRPSESGSLWRRAPQRRVHAAADEVSTARTHLTPVRRQRTEAAVELAAPSEGATPNSCIRSSISAKEKRGKKTHEGKRRKHAVSMDLQEA